MGTMGHYQCSSLLRSYHGTYLSVTPDNGVRLANELMDCCSPDKSISLNSNFNDWEKKRSISLGNSYHGTYVSAQKSKPLDMATKPLEWERWTRVEKDGFIYFLILLHPDYRPHGIFI